MTNAELIAKIKAEIERLKTVQLKRIQEGDLVDAEPYDKNEAYNELLDFLDTLESEAKEEKKVPTRIYLGSRYEFIRKDILLNEIERLKNNNEVSDDKEYASYELDVACGYDMACNDIFSFLKPFAEVDKHPKNILAPSKECEPGLREPLEESEKPMNQEGLEEEIQKYMSERWEFGCINSTTPVYLYDFTTDELKECARHFAQWGAEHFRDTTKKIEPPCHTVEEWIEHIKNADQLTKDIFSEGPYDVLYDAINHPYRDCYDAIKEFGELCYQTARQDMMKEAVEGTIVYDYEGGYATIKPNWLVGNIGDKVRVIVIPNTDEK